MEVCPASIEELADCQAIYAHHVLHGTGTFEEIPPSLEEITARFEAVTKPGCPWLVAKDASGVLGFGYYAQFRNRSAYRFCAENSVYVRETVRGQGVGKAIVAALLEHAAKAGFTQMLAVIGDSENTGSIGVHASLGFVQVGTMRKVGFKFERWLA
jgi:L-amino acid N-acyltransferase YncA